MNHSTQLDTLKLFLSKEHPCGYFADRQARSLVPDPVALDIPLYSSLAALGFRRNGNLVYRPHCGPCQACIPLRISSNDFVPNRAQRRIRKRNAGLQVIETEARYDQEHFDLFKRYISARHPAGGMDDGDENNYHEFIDSQWCETRLIEFRDGQQLVAVAVTDYLEDGLSALYTFFEPTLEKHSLGTFAVLWQIEQAHRLALPWVYLGYWIKKCRKMAYKKQFRPCQVLLARHWQWLPEE